MSNGSSYIVKEGTKEIEGCAFRKRSQLSSVVMNEELMKIGDAAFSYCSMLTEVTIPSAVKWIGVAAFCSSGLKTVTFEGVPEYIGSGAFSGCDKLLSFVVPKGSRKEFSKLLGIDENRITECGGEKPEKQQYVPKAGLVTEQKDLFGGSYQTAEESNLFAFAESTNTEKASPSASCHLTYNHRDFVWHIGDIVNLNELFSSTVYLNHLISYEIRKRVLFIFLKKKTADSLNPTKSNRYQIGGVNPYVLDSIYVKYGNPPKPTRVLLFVSDGQQNALFYDEVSIDKVVAPLLSVHSLIRYLNK